MYQFFEGDCSDIFPTFETASIDAIVTDPPAGIGFMGKEWDKDKGGRDAWIDWMTDIAKQCHRVLKPGGHAFVWALPRTAHWTMTAYENAGFEVRDVLMHIFASGFPKSLDVSKAIDNHLGMTREKVSVDSKRLRNHKTHGGGRDGTKGASRPYIERGMATGKHETDGPIPQSDAARHFEGWGTGLKPCAEHWILLRKPLRGSVASNVLVHGTGALNIDKCRLPARGVKRTMNAKLSSNVYGKINVAGGKEYPADLGRFPGNVVIDGSAIVQTHFDIQGLSTCFFYSPKPSVPERDRGLKGVPKQPNENWPQSLDGQDDRGAAPRSNIHPTVKSVELMRYLVTLITPPAGIVLDPFMGSGSTGIACANEGFSFIGIEQNPEYVKIASRRVAYAFANSGRGEESLLGGLFTESDPPHECAEGDPLT